MRRLWIACGILAALFAAALYNTWHLDRLTASLSDQLTRAEACAEAGNWEEAARLTEERPDLDGDRNVSQNAGQNKRIFI